MSLSRLEKEAVQAEEARVTTLREKARADTVDERKLRKKVEAEVREHTRFCVKALEDNIWWYKDRAGLSRGPLQLTTLRACWVQGVVDEATLVWGQGLEAWYPVRNVVGLVANIQSLDVICFKFLYDRIFLRPRLERVRRQRKEALKALKSGAVTLTAEQQEQIKAEGSTLKIDELSAPHPALRAYFAEKAKQVDDPAPAAPRRTPAAACLTLALPLAGWQQARE